MEARPENFPVNVCSMKIQFVGVGEAFDETLPNNSQLLEWENTRLLIDCGYAVPHSLWKLHPEPEFVDAIYISHRHADHYFGLPSYLLRLDEDGRKRPVEILCPEGMKQVILEMMDYAYQNLVSHLEFDLVFHEVSSEKSFSFRNAKLQFAPSSHPVRNYAISVESEDRRYAYSGDGNFNEHTCRLYRASSFVTHEAYSLNEEAKGHARIDHLLRMAKEQQIQKLALTHIQRDIRKNRMNEIRKLIESSGLAVVIPHVGEQFEI